MNLMRREVYTTYLPKRGRLSTTRWALAACIVSLFLILAASSNAEQRLLRISDSHAQVDLVEYAQVLEDPKSEFTFYNIRNTPDFKPLDERILGFNHSTFWIKLEIINHTRSEQWFLEKSFANSHEFDLYQKDSDGKYQLSRGGILNIMKPHGYRHRKPLFYLHLPTDKRSTIFIRYKSNASINFNMTLWPEKTFDEKLQRDYFWHGIFYGVFLILIIGNIMLLIKRMVLMQLLSLFFSLTSIVAVVIFDGSLITVSTTLFWSLQTYFFPIIIASITVFTLLALRYILAEEKSNKIHFNIIDGLITALITTGFIGMLFTMGPFAAITPFIFFASILYTLITFAIHFRSIPLASKLQLSVMVICVSTILAQAIFSNGLSGINIDVSDFTRLAVMFSALAAASIYLFFYFLHGFIGDSSLQGSADSVNFHAIFEKSFNFIAFLNQEGKIKAINCKTPFSEIDNEMFTNEDFHSLPGFDADENQEITIQECIENAKNNLNTRVELTVKKKSGEEYWIDFSFSPFLDKNNNIDTIIVEGRDITNQKRAENALRKIASGAPINNLEETLHYFVKEISHLVNAKYAFVGEYDKEHPNTIKTRSICCNGAIVENISYNIHDTASKNVINAEFCIIPRDASSVYPNDELIKKLNIESYVGTPLVDSKGDMLGILCVLDDKPIQQNDRFDEILQIFANRISSELERREIETQKKDATDKLSFHIQNSPIAYIECDDKFNVVDWNPAAQRLFGYSKNEVLERPINHFIFREQSEVAKDENMRSIIANKHGRFTRTTNINKRGETLICEWHNTLLLSTSGELMGISSLVVDITAEEAALQSIKEKEIEQRETLETLNDAVIIFDNRGEILSINHATTQLFGYQAAEIIGCHFKILIPDYALEISDKSGNATNDKISLCTDHEISAKNSYGEYFPSALTINSLPISENKPPRFIGIFRDLSTIKLQEEQLRRTQKMDALGKLTGGIAHDFNNILGVITGYTDLLKMMSKDEKVSRYANEIRHASDRGAKLTSKLLSFSRKHSGTTELININELLKDNQHMLERTLSAKVTFNYSLAENLWTTETDGNELEDAILNLSINAMHAIEDSGSVSISTRNVSLDPEAAHSRSLSPGNYVVVEIADTGQGIPKDILDKIFDPFFTTKGEKGTGLGLSQVYGFMERNKGGIFVDSKIGLGTTFSLYFPSSVNDDTTTATEKNREITPPPNNPHYSILAVDDNLAMLGMLKELLELNGYSVIASANPNEALNILENHSVDLVISDIMMPELNGYEFADAISAKYPNIKIQLVSGYVDDTEGLKQEHPLTATMIKKPYHADELIPKINSLMTR